MAPPSMTITSMALQKSHDWRRHRFLPGTVPATGRPSSACQGLVTVPCGTFPGNGVRSLRNGRRTRAARRSPKVHAFLGFVRTASGYEIVPASAALFAKGLHLHEQRPDKEWSLTDCIWFVVLSDRGISRALTHDHHYEQAGFEALLRRDPP